MSYATEAELSAYATARGITITGTPAVLLTKAHDWLESMEWAGHRTTVGQADSWPRVTTILKDDWTTLPIDEIPDDIKRAEMECALIYDAGGDPLATVTRAKKRIKVDVIETEYADNAVVNPIYPILNRLIAKYLNTSQTGGTSFSVNRV